MATKKRRRFAEGGISEAADKESGLKASQGEKVGFFERLRMGNIDDPSSEAYKRFGAGRAKADRDMKSEAAAMRMVDDSRAASAQSSAKEDEPEITSDQYLGAVEAAPAKRVASPRLSVPAKKEAASKKEPAMQEQTYRRTSGDSGEREKEKAYTRKEGATAMGMSSNYGNEGRGREMTKEQQYARAEAEAKSSEGKAKRKKQEESQALERVTPETALFPGGGLKALNTAAKSLANRGAGTGRTAAQKAWDRSQVAERLKPTQAVSSKTAEQIAREKKTMNPMAWMAGPKGMADDFKRGGKVKSAKPVKKMASGGSTSGASKRADGIAQRGKTRGRIY